MKALVLILALLAAGSAVPAFAQTTLADWTFETSQPLTAGPFNPEVGSGSASGAHAGAAVYSTPVGNASAHSFSSSVWAVGDYYQFQTSTSAFSGIQLSWDQTSSSTGPENFGFYYSTNGSTFTQFGPNYTVLGTSWSSVTAHPESHFTYDLSSITALNNDPAVYFRLVDLSTVSANGGTVGTGGTDRVDNVLIAAIPEPSTSALLLGAATSASVFILRRRKAAKI